nr:vesicle-associated membrane protein 727 [Tanacetum cinerariifolium]
KKIRKCKLSKLKAQITEVKGIMMDNIDKRVKDDFKQRYGGSIGSDHPLGDESDDLFEDRFSIAYNLDREFGPILKEHMDYCLNHPDEMSKLSKLKAQITE